MSLGRHHGAWLRLAVVEIVQGETTTFEPAVGPEHDAVGSKTVGAFVDDVMVCGWHDDDGVCEGVRPPTATTRFLKEGYDVVRIVEVDDVLHIGNIE